MKTNALTKFTAKKFPVLFILLVIAALLIYFYSQKTQSPKVLSANTPAQTAAADFENFANYTKKVGVETAYRVLKEKYPNNQPQAHDLAHIIGIVAYEKSGMQGLKICDTAYNYGCYHGFIEAFLAKNDLALVVQIEKACFDLGSLHSPSCLHGIGHGVMIARSYNLDLALEDCDRLQTQSQIYCHDGVFMERITGSMQKDKQKSPVIKENLNFPCDSIASKYQKQCWRNQPAAWIAYFQNNISKTGSQCLAIVPEFQDTCLESLGFLIAMNTQDDAAQIKNLCTFQNGQVSDTCLTGVIRELMFEGKSPKLAQNLCQYASMPQNCLNLFEGLLEEYNLRFGQKTNQ